MPTAHIAQWKHNRAFISTIDPAYPDWAVTAAFYAALQAIDALLRHDKVTGITSHAARNHVLAQQSRYTHIFRHYYPLYSLSRTVRYMADPRKWVPWEQVGAQVVSNYLYPIERSVLKLMGTGVTAEPVALRQPFVCPRAARALSRLDRSSAGGTAQS